MPVIQVLRNGPRATVLMNRPEKHNAFNPELIKELTEAFLALGEDSQVRVIVLAGEGRSFSAGADLDWMKAEGEASYEDNLESSKRMGELFRTIDQCPKPVVAKIQGAALGGGAGLVCVADMAVAGPKALLGFTEVRLGLVAAVISPFVLRRLGFSVTREKLLSGERFDAAEALRIGLVHKMSDDLDGAVEELVESVLKGSTQAQAASKRLLAEIAELEEPEQLEITAAYIARARASKDGRHGLSAFLRKQKPDWVPS